MTKSMPTNVRRRDAPKETRPSPNAQLKNMASRALPVIEHHYAMAQELAKLKGVTS